MHSRTPKHNLVHLSQSARGSHSGSSALPTRLVDLSPQRSRRSRRQNEKGMFFVSFVVKSVSASQKDFTSPVRGELRTRIRNGLVKSERLDVTAEFAQRVETFCRTRARIAHEVVETLFPGDHDKMRHATRQTHTDDHRISVRQV